MINDMIADNKNDGLKLTIPCIICGKIKYSEEIVICKECGNYYCYSCGSLVDDVCENCEEWSG